MECQSDQERREAKSIYHSEKEDSYIPILETKIKAIEGSESKASPASASDPTLIIKS